MKIICVAGARPNFVKIAPLLAAFASSRESQPASQVLFVHTGQHYDAAMSGSLMADLRLPPPDINLGVGSGTHAEQTARVMVAFESVLLSEKPDIVIVVGDVNSTLGCAIAAAKLLVPVAHVEAGLRSFDRTMPEEINRILTDAISELCFTTCLEANRNLQAEGVPSSKVFFVGNVMIDTLVENRPRAERPALFDSLGLTEKDYAVITLHRPINVDAIDDARRVVSCIDAVASRMPVLFPVHPRTASMFARHGLTDHMASMQRLHLVGPLPYLQFLYTLDHAGVVLTDSGGIQEETTMLDVPCLTLRENTERGVTISDGTNRLVGLRPAAIGAAVDEVLEGGWPRGRRPELWDGRSAQRIVRVILHEWRKNQTVPADPTSLS